MSLTISHPNRFPHFLMFSYNGAVKVFEIRERIIFGTICSLKRKNKENANDEKNIEKEIFFFFPLL